MIEKEENICDIQAIIKGPEGTPYEGGAFQIKLVLGSDFPISPPKGFFFLLYIYINLFNIIKNNSKFYIYTYPLY